MHKNFIYRILSYIIISLGSSGLYAASNTCLDIGALDCSGQCNTAHSFFRARPFSQDLALELSLQQWDMYYHGKIGQPEGHHLSLQITPFFYQSTDRRQLSTYFLPHGKGNMIIAQNNASDISSAWVNLLHTLDNPYNSTVTLRPFRRAIGGCFKGYLDFGQWISTRYGWLASTWASVYLPVANVHHRMNLAEVQHGGIGQVAGFEDAAEAFNNPAWKFGKISPTTLKKTHVDDLQVKLGWNMLHDETRYYGIYVVGFAPTGMTSKAEYVFEPLVGTGHAGIGFGLNESIMLANMQSSALYLMGEFRYAYFLARNEIRSFDLCNGDWSRYLLVADPAKTNVTLPGINSFTKSVNVTPGSTVELWVALHAHFCHYDVELGYDFWWRQEEKLCTPCCPLTVGIFDYPGCCTRTSASTAKICQAIRGTSAPTSDEVFTPVNVSQLSARSARTPAAATNKLYAAVSGSFETCNGLPAMLGLGGMYEFGSPTTALTQFGVWLKASLDI